MDKGSNRSKNMQSQPQSDADPVYQLWLSLRHADFIKQQPLKEPVFISHTPLNLSGKDFRGCLFANKDLSHATFFATDLTACAFKNSAFKNADLSHSMLLGANFSDICAEEAIFCHADLTGVVIEKSNFSHANFESAQLKDFCATHSHFNFSNFKYADFHFANLSFSDFTGADLSHSTLYNTNFEDIILIDTNLSGANLTYAQNLLPKQLSKAKNLHHAVVDPEDKHMSAVLQIALLEK